MKNDTFKTIPWIRTALFNFCVVALAGVVLRYKINFPLPVVNQKYLLHAHSHFAFTGWVSLALMALMVNFLQQQNINANYKRYRWILLANCIVSYGMLFSFIAQGYALYSITFSTLSIFVSYFFIYSLWKDLSKVRDDSYTSVWFKAALMIWAISSLGAFTLAYLMANHITVQDYYFAAIYFFLHFQYNGWFLFACLGLLLSYLSQNGLGASVSVSKRLFWIMAITVGPAYLLSILWLRLPKWLHLIADISGVLQLLVLFYFVRVFLLIRKIKYSLASTTKYMWIMMFIAFILKVILQFLSIFPFLSKYAFGFRPIVIGYLHLSFLGIISFFILGYMDQLLNQTQRRISKGGVIVFVGGVLLQEVILMVQGFEVMEFEPLPYANLILFAAALLMASGLIWITLSVSKIRTVIPGKSELAFHQH